MLCEEAGQGLGKLHPVDGVREEVPPCGGHALEAADRSGREAREDFNDEIIGEVSHRGPPSLGPSPLNHPEQQVHLHTSSGEDLPTGRAAGTEAAASREVEITCSERRRLLCSTGESTLLLARIDDPWHFGASLFEG